MAQLKDLIVNGATRLLNGLNVSGSIKQNSEQVVTKVNNIAPDDSGHLSVSIPTVNNATLTINQNNTSKGTFTANSSTNTTINLTDTTYSSQAAASGGTAVSLVTTGEKYTWNNKGTYSKPSGGIPKTDLASAVQTSLGRADTALQSAPVTSVNSKTGTVSLSASDVGAAATSHTHTKSQITDFPTLATVATSGSYNDLSNKPTIPPAITIDSALSNTSTNPVQNKVINTALNGKVPTTRKVNGKALSSDVTLMSADILVAGDRTIDDAFSTVNTNINNLSTSKQATLVSGTNIKTINSTSLLGSGNITIQESAITDARIEEICDVGGGGFNLTVQASSLPYRFTIYYADNTSETFNYISDLNGTHENVVAFHGENFLGVVFDKTYTFDIYDEQSEQTTSGTSNNYSFRGVKRIIMSEDMSITNMVDED